jgi:hypothetical protein
MFLMFQYETDGTATKFLFKFMRLGEPIRGCAVLLGSLAERRDMGKAEQYRHYAAECIRLARQSQYPPEKDSLLRMAESWRRLAQHAETMCERKSESPPK